MASQVRRRGRLDATDREVVFCHACAFEWYREAHGLNCPSCWGDITEIVSVDNDPRPLRGIEDDEDEDEHDDVYEDYEDEEDGADDMPEILANMQEAEEDEGDDSDPEEADIDDHVDPNGFGYEQDTQGGEGADHYDSDPRRSVERFLNVVSTIGVPFGTETNRQLINQLTRAAATPQGRVEWANETSQGSVTIFSSNGPLPAAEHAPLGFENFSTMFNGAFRGFGVQLTGEALEAAAEQDGRNEIPNLAGTLGDLLNLFNNGVHGDGVYTQEALDRIITSLMDANPQSNAAPPASVQGLASLPRRTLDEDLKSEDGNTECSICIDGMKEGETIVSLPCKHSFHDECVVLWLKEHNTCPVCRAPMEGRAADESNANRASSAGQNRRQPHAPTPAENPGDEVPSPAAETSPPLDGEQTQTPQASGSSRPPNQGQTRINQAMRYLSSQQREQDRSRGASTSFSFDTSRLQRRSSMSPTSPRVAVGEGERRMRERSPSQNSRRTGSTGDDQSSNSGNGAMGWLRGRFVD